MPPRGSMPRAPARQFAVDVGQLPFGYPASLCPPDTKPSDDVFASKQRLMAYVREDGTRLNHIDHLWSDVDVVRAGVRQNGMAIRFVKQPQLSNKDVVLAAVRENARAIKHVDPSNPHYNAAAIEAVEKEGGLLRLVDRKCRDKEVVLAAVAQAGDALQHVDPPLLFDREVVLTALRQNGHALAHVSTIQRWNAMKYTAAQMQEMGVLPPNYAPPVRTDDEVVAAALRQSGTALEYVLAPQLYDMDVNLAAVRQCGLALA